jgi:hypothetical protein
MPETNGVVDMLLQGSMAVQPHVVVKVNEVSSEIPIADASCDLIAATPEAPTLASIELDILKFFAYDHVIEIVCRQYLLGRSQHSAQSSPLARNTGQHGQSGKQLSQLIVELVIVSGVPALTNMGPLSTRVHVSGSAAQHGCVSVGIQAPLHAE